ncbi:MAG: O-acetyl-ADP-ribose deacetylase [Bacteroidales bacterium]
MKIQLIQGDITTMKVDAIVNAANSSLLGGGGVDGAIHRAGGSSILEECKAIRSKKGICHVGQAVITGAGNMPAKHVIHTVGPVWYGGNNKEEALLYSAYESSLKLAEKYQLKSIAFPNISTGIYHFPKQRAAEISIRAIKDFSEYGHIQELFFVCFDSENYNIYTELLAK